MAADHLGVIGVGHASRANALDSARDRRRVRRFPAARPAGEASAERGADPAELATMTPGGLAITHHAGEAAVTRRGWSGAAGGAGLADALGSWFGLIDLSTADAVATRSRFDDAITCPDGCFCCRLNVRSEEANLPDLLLQRLHRNQRRRGHPDAHRPPHRRATSATRSSSRPARSS